MKTETQGQSHVVRAKIGVMQYKPRNTKLPAKPQKLGRGGRIPLQVFRGSMALPTP